MSFPKLEDDLLYVITFGPGFGESIVLRVPPDTWVVVDGCRMDRDVPAASLLTDHGARWSVVVLTHPHLDHAVGLEEVLTRPGGGFVGCAEAVVEDPEQWRRDVDTTVIYRKGVLEDVIAAIRNLWESDASLKWELRRGECRTAGAAKLTALHPDRSVVEKFRKGKVSDPNRLATPLLVEWKRARVLLGSDLTSTDWSDVAKEYADLGAHVVKVPHHGSREALHESLAPDRDCGRTWVVTPYNRGRRLPQFGSDGGIAWLLDQEPSVHLTGLPVAHRLQGEVPFRTTREGIAAGRKPRAVTSKLAKGRTAQVVPTPGGYSCYVVVGLDAQGQVVDRTHGAGSVIVERGGRRTRSRSRSPIGKPRVHR